GTDGNQEKEKYFLHLSSLMRGFGFRPGRTSRPITNIARFFKGFHAKRQRKARGARPAMNRAAARAARYRSVVVGRLPLLETSPFDLSVTADGSSVSGGSHVLAVRFRLFVDLVIHTAADVLVVEVVLLLLLL
ncbi:MAG: hypothetical protein NTW26_00165, partial [bacterium]|nr:hypothetical protein [bacterium]